jgi:uncharacterized Zn-binding protein involved in type VI secretion
MPGAVRLGDVDSGHGCFPPRVNSSASPDVIVNGRGAHRVGDSWVTHCCGKSCHSSSAATGSSTVFVNGKAKCVVGCAVACGSTMVQGSANVIVGL